MSAKRRAKLRLDERGPFEVSVALAHPAQQVAARVVAELIGHLRGGSEMADFENFQRVLFQEIYAADEQRAEARRNENRHRRRPSATSTSVGWANEVMVADRICRQLRCIGDALAWRMFGFDRRPLVALANNDLSGSTFGKQGLGYELGAVVEAWEQRGNFALLHDITNTLRLGDLTEFTDGGPRVAEVKASRASSSGSRAARQRNRLRAAVAAVMDGTPFNAEGTRLVETAVPLRTHLAKLEPLFDRSRSEGLLVAAIDNGFIVTVLDARAAEVLGDHEDARHRYDTEMQTLRAQHFAEEEHILEGYSIDTRDLHAAVAPYSIFPFEPETCAELVTDRLIVRATIGWKQLAAPFDRLGWRTYCPLPSDGSDTPDPVLVATKGDLTLALHRDALVQVLVEFHDLDQLAAATIEVANRRVPGDGYLVFGDEHKVWR